MSCNLTKSEILNWINTVLPECQVQKIEHLGTGVVFCQLLNYYHPGIIPNSKINVRPTQNIVDFTSNFRLLQQALYKLGYQKQLKTDRLSRQLFSENFELANQIFQIVTNQEGQQKYNSKAQKNCKTLQSQKKIQLNFQINSNQTPINREELLKQHMADKSLSMFERMRKINDLYQFGLSEFKIQENQSSLLNQKNNFIEQQMQGSINEILLLSSQFQDTNLKSQMHNDSGSKCSDYMELLTFESNNKINLFTQKSSFNLEQETAPSAKKKEVTFAIQEEKVGYTFHKKDQNLQCINEESHEKYPCSSQKKLYEIQVCNSQNQKISPQFSKTDIFVDQNYNPNQIMTSQIENSKYSIQPQRSSKGAITDEIQLQTYQMKKNAQSLPVSKNKSWFEEQSDSWKNKTTTKLQSDKIIEE